MDESWRTLEWVIPYMWLSHAAHMIESCRTYEWVMSRRSRLTWCQYCVASWCPYVTCVSCWTRRKRRQVLRVAVCCGVLRCVAVRCSVLQCVAAHFPCVATWPVYLAEPRGKGVSCSVLQCVAVCCSVIQCVEVCCIVLQCVAGCCSVFQHISWCRYVTSVSWLTKRKNSRV